MKKLFTLLLLLPLFSTAQSFLYGGGTFSSESYKGASIGIGDRKGVSAVGITGYYSERYNISVHADLHLFLKSNDKMFLFFQPGWNFSNGGRIDLKTGFGIMTKSPGIYFHTGYNLLVINQQKINTGFVMLGIRI